MIINISPINDTNTNNLLYTIYFGNINCKISLLKIIIVIIASKTKGDIVVKNFFYINFIKLLLKVLILVTVILDCNPEITAIVSNTKTL